MNEQEARPCSLHLSQSGLTVQSDPRPPPQHTHTYTRTRAHRDQHASATVETSGLDAAGDPRRSVSASLGVSSSFTERRWAGSHWRRAAVTEDGLRVTGGSTLSLSPSLCHFFAFLRGGASFFSFFLFLLPTAVARKSAGSKRRRGVSPVPGESENDAADKSASRFPLFR